VLFAIDPFPYIGRTIPEFNAVDFTKRKKQYGVAINKPDFLKIQRQFALFLTEQFSERFHGMPINAATNAENKRLSFRDKSVDSVAHRCDHRAGCDDQVSFSKRRLER
jgi:hypothetical protein